MSLSFAGLRASLLLVSYVVIGDAKGRWWETDVMYQIYPRSFKDANGDGTGDLKGIQEKLPYLKDLGVGFIWLSPVMKSPMLDFGYDISDFFEVDPLFGSMQDMKDLIDAANKSGIRILMDFVPNHSSNYSHWFAESRSSKTNPKRDWYIWHAGNVLDNGTHVPPNNWASNFGGPLGSSWTFDEQTEEYYYHAFGEFQPDLNYHNPEVVEAMKDVLRFWLNMGIGGFRIDAVPFLLEDPQLRDEPVNIECAKTEPIWNCMDHKYTQNAPENHEIIRGWRKAVDEFDDRVMFGEIYADLPDLMKYYGTPEEPEFNVPFNFNVLGMSYGEPNDLRNATVVRDAIADYAAAKPEWAHGNWVLGNHDNHRLMNRVHNDTESTKSVYNLLNLIPGTPTIYNGDELAMRDLFIPYDKCQDPMCLKNPKTFAVSGRDPERTPMQWDSSAQAGFSINPHTWLPINPNYVTVNVEEERKDDESPLSVMMRTLRFRAGEPDIAMGHITHVAKDVPSDIQDKIIAVQFQGELSLVVTVGNWDTKQPVTFDLQSLLTEEAQAKPPSSWSFRFSTVNRPLPASVDMKQFTLLSGEVAVVSAISSPIYYS